MSCRATNPIRDQNKWKETTATVLACRYHHAKWWNFGAYKPYANPVPDESYFVTRFSYRVEGVTYYGTIDGDQERREGQHFVICYDPLVPGHNSMEPTPSVRLYNWIFKACVFALGLYLAYRFGPKR